MNDLPVDEHLPISFLPSPLPGSRGVEQLEMQDDERDRLVPDAFCCSITQSMMVDPVILIDGHSHERAAIAKWFGQRQQQSCRRHHRGPG